MKILILGRDGQVGTALTATLAPLGEIVAYGADFTRPDDVAALVRRQTPDVIVNAAAYTALDKAESEAEIATLVNATTPGRLATVARETGARLIHISTDYVFDGAKPEPYVETIRHRRSTSMAAASSMASTRSPRPGPTTSRCAPVGCTPPRMPTSPRRFSKRRRSSKSCGPSTTSRAAPPALG